MIAIGWSLILFQENLSFYQLAVTLWITGFFSGCMILSFAFVSESVPQSLSGTVSGLINMGVMMGPTLLQPVVGRILDSNWTGQLDGTVRIYSLDAYESGFIPIIVWSVISVFPVSVSQEISPEDQHKIF